MTSNKILVSENKVSRHSSFTLLLHWLLALTILNAIISLVMKSKTGQTLHVLGGCIMGLVLAVHLIYHHLIRRRSPLLPRQGDVQASKQLLQATFVGTQEPPNDKYLPEQRLAYLYILLCVILVTVTGLAKVVGGEHRHGAIHSHNFLQILGMLHGPAVFLLIVGIAAHLGAFAIKANRPLLISMFNGKVDLDYVKRRHQIWYAKLQRKS